MLCNFFPCKFRHDYNNSNQQVDKTEQKNSTKSNGQKIKTTISTNEMLFPDLDCFCILIFFYFLLAVIDRMNLGEENKQTNKKSNY